MRGTGVEGSMGNVKFNLVNYVVLDGLVSGLVVRERNGTNSVDEATIFPLAAKCTISYDVG